MRKGLSGRARKVMLLANQEAQSLNQEYIDTEHILLGLVQVGLTEGGVAATALKTFGIELYRIRLEVEKLVQSGPDIVTIGKLPQTPRVQKAIEYAGEEVRTLKHKYLGTEHILLGLLREAEGVAAQVLINLGLKLENVRQEVLNLLGHGMNDDQQALTSKPRWVIRQEEVTATISLAPSSRTDIQRDIFLVSVSEEEFKAAILKRGAEGMICITPITVSLPEA